MNYTQNEKIEQVTDSTIVVGVDILQKIKSTHNSQKRAIRS